MKIVHISDIHLANLGAIIWDTDTKSHFDRAIEIITEMKSIDAIIITGDLSDDGSSWAYKYIDNAFSKTGIPTFCCPGNHDDIKLMRSNIFQFIKVPNKSLINDCKLLLLDSTMPNMARGMLYENQMQNLQYELESDSRPTIIAFHHPSFEPGGWLNRKLLENREELNSLLFKFSNVKLVLYGHIHYSIQHKLGGAIFSAAPSIGYAFDLNLPKFQIAKGEEAFNLINIESDNIQINTIKL